VSSIKQQIESLLEQEITYLTKSLDDKIEVETKKVKKEVVEDLLNELLSNENINLSQDDLANIVLKKVA
jgi:F-type H+-transporting ATPase subunit b